MFFNKPVIEDWNYQHFTREEMECHCGCGGVPTHEFMMCLEKLREHYAKPIVISSGYRCMKQNIKVGGVQDSAHTRGLAADIKISGKEAYNLLHCAMELGFTGIGISQNGLPTKRFIHLDIVTGMMRPWLWSY